MERLEPRRVFAADSPEGLARFESVAALRDYLLDDGARRYEYLFGQPTYAPCWDVCAYERFADDYATQVEALSAGSPHAFVGSDGQNVSTTNVQVAGVDEGDVVETDGRRLYVLGRRELAVVDVATAADPTLLIKLDLPGEGVAEYLHGDRLTVISTDRFWGDVLPLLAAPDADGLVRSRPFAAPVSSVIVTVFDVSDPSAPRVVEETRLDGDYRDSRAIGDKLLVTLSDSRLSLPPPQMLCDESSKPAPVSNDGSAATALIVDDGARRFAPLQAGCVYESAESWRTRMLDELDANLLDRLPHFTSYEADGRFARAGLLHEPAELVRPATPDATQILSLVTFDVDDSDPGVLAAEGIVADWTSSMYVSASSVVVTAPEWRFSDEGGVQTRLMFFRWDQEFGAPVATAVGAVPGSLVNSFAIDEFRGDLRVATTLDVYSPVDSTWRTENHLFVLRPEGDELRVIGSLTGFGDGERIQSVRFDGELGFVVTFLRTDPLFTLDLSRPESPRLLGELVLPGFSGYLQRLDATHLLGLGLGPAGGQNEWSPQLTLFDVNDLSAPRVLDQFAFRPGDGTIASGDHHAILWNSATHVLTLPMQRWGPDGTFVTYEDGSTWPRYGQWNDLYAFRIDDPLDGSVGDRFEALGTISHDSPVRRGVTIGDALYSLSDTDVKSAIAAPGMTPYATLDLFDADPPYVFWNEIPFATSLISVDEASTPPAPVTPSPLDDDEFTSLLEAARADLRARLGAESDAPRVVSIEAFDAANADDGEPRFQFVLAIGDSRFLYRGDARSGAELLDEQFEFQVRPERSPWNNEHDALDASADGSVAPLDALVVINELNAHGARALRTAYPLRAIATATVDFDVDFFWDVDGDHYLSPRDALLVVNWLNSQAGAGEGESPTDVPALPPLAPDEAPRTPAPSWTVAVDAVVTCDDSDSAWWES